MHFHQHRHGPPHTGAKQRGHSFPMPERPSTEFIVLDPAKIQFRRENGKLTMMMDGAEEAGEIRVLRLFPLSDPEGWVSVIAVDGREIGIVRTLDELDPDSRNTVLDVLFRRYAVPQIARIVACREKFDLVEWEVETDRGGCRFVMRNPRETIQRAGNNRLALMDVEGNRYDVPDLDALDARSRTAIERYF